MEHYAPMDTSPAHGIGMERGGANRGPMTEPDVNKHYPAAVAGAHAAGECWSPGLTGVRGSALCLRAGVG